MLNARRVGLVVVLALAAAAIFAFLGLPFANMGITSVNAQYGSAQASAESLCGTSVTTQVVFTAPVNLYSDSALLNRVTTVTALPAKFLVCGTGSTATSLKVYFAGNIYWVPFGAQLARNARFPQ
jgi:hypothetical protein